MRLSSTIDEQVPCENQTCRSNPLGLSILRFGKQQVRRYSLTPRKVWRARWRFSMSSFRGCATWRASSGSGFSIGSTAQDLKSAPWSSSLPWIIRHMECSLPVRQRVRIQSVCPLFAYWKFVGTVLPLGGWISWTEPRCWISNPTLHSLTALRSYGQAGVKDRVLVKTVADNRIDKE